MIKEEVLKYFRNRSVFVTGGRYSIVFIAITWKEIFLKFLKGLEI